jgi:5'-3' exonuclease
MRVLLGDADIFAFRLASRNQTSVDFGDGEETLHYDMDELIEDTKEYLADLTEELEADELIICLSDDYENWRKAVHPQYKENRQGSKRPELLYPLKEYMFENYKSFRKPLLEADDVMGILATHPSLIKGEKVIVSEDKDMLTIPGLLFKPHHPEEGIIESSEIDADRYWMYQTLIGDTTDNYKGAKGIGPKKAEVILDGLETVEEMWPAVVEAYLSKNMTEEDALMNARVARICRRQDYDFKKQEVKLWQPPKL